MPHKIHPSSSGLVSYISKHRFSLMMAACALVFSVMMVVIYSTVGFAPVTDSHNASTAP